MSREEGMAHDAVTPPKRSPVTPDTFKLNEGERRKTRVAVENERNKGRLLFGEQQHKHNLERDQAKRDLFNQRKQARKEEIAALSAKNREWQAGQSKQRQEREQLRQERQAKRAQEQAERRDGAAYVSQHPTAPKTPLSDQAVAALRRHHIVLRPQKFGERRQSLKQGKQAFFTPELEHRHPLDVLADKENPWLDHSARRILEDYDVGFRDYTPQERLKNAWAVGKHGLPKDYYGDKKTVLTPRASPVQIDYDNRKETELKPNQSPESRKRVGATMQHLHNARQGKPTHVPHIGHRLPFLFRKFE